MSQTKMSVSGFNHMERVAQTIFSGVDYWSKWNTYNDVTLAGQPDNTTWIYPRIALTEIRDYGYTNGTTRPRRYADGFKVLAVGEEAFYKPSGPSEFINYSAGAPLDSDNLYEDYFAATSYKHTRYNISPKYVGIDLEGVGGEDDYGGLGDLTDDNVYNNNFSYDIVDMWAQDPYTLDHADIKAMFSTNEWTTKISGLIELETHGALKNFDDFIAAHGNDLYFNGDCFLQRVYFKQRYSYGESDDDLLADKYAWDLKRSYLSHGLTVGIVVQCKYNHSMRFPSTNGNDYYPHVEDTARWALSLYSDSDAESWLRNDGYSVMKHLKAFLGYNPLSIYSAPNYPTRIRYSDPTIPGEIRNAYKLLRYGNYQDYDLAYGDMMNVVNISNWLISVQYDSINRHFVDEKEVSQTGEAGPLMIGTGATLPKVYRRLAEFGSQHTFGTCKDAYAYGIDSKRRILWRIGVAMSDTRGLYPTAENLTAKTMTEKWMYDFFDQFEWWTDKTVSTLDNPAYMGGFVTGFNSKFNEVDFTLHGKVVLQGTVHSYGLLGFTSIDISSPDIENLIIGQRYLAYYDYEDERVNVELSLFEFYPKPGSWTDYVCKFYYEGGVTPITLPIGVIVYLVLDNTTYSKTITFSQNNDFFLSPRSYTPHGYLSLYNDYFSVLNDPPSASIFQHNNPDPALRCTFYGTLYPWMLSFISHDDNPFIKLWKNNIVDCPLHDTGNLAQQYYLFEEIDYETEQQNSIHSPVIEISDPNYATHEHWIDPRYKEGKMHATIKSVDQGSLNYSYMRGVWIKQTFVFEKAVESYIKNVITMYNVSVS
jgi:hypothetical protein